MKSPSHPSATMDNPVSDPNMLFGELRSLVQSAPEPRAWGRICQLVDVFDANTQRDMVFPYLTSALRRWPDAMRVAPISWTRQIMRGHAHAKFDLVRTLRLEGKALGARAIEPLCRVLDDYNLTVIDLSGSGLKDEATQILLRQPLLSRIHTLKLNDNQLGWGALGAITQSEHLENLHTLELDRATEFASGLEILSGAKNLPNLREFSFSTSTQSELEVEPAWQFSRAPWLAQLERLSIKNLFCSSGAFDSILAALPETLRELNLCHIYRGLGHDFILSASLPELHTLTLRDCQIRSDDVAQLAAASCAENLKHLDLSHNSIGAHLTAFDSDAAFPALESLSLASNTLSPGALHDLLSTARQLDSLSLGDCYLDGRHLEQLHRSATRTRHLDISHNVALSPKIAAWRGELFEHTRSLCANETLCTPLAFADLVALDWVQRGLEELDVSRAETNLTQKDIPKVELQKLSSLTMKHCFLTVLKIRALRKRLTMPSLARLDLSGNLFGSEGVFELEDAPWLAHIEALILDAVHCPEAIDAFIKKTDLPKLELLSAKNNTIAHYVLESLEQTAKTRHFTLYT